MAVSLHLPGTVPFTHKLGIFCLGSIAKFMFVLQNKDWKVGRYAGMHCCLVGGGQACPFCVSTDHFDFGGPLSLPGETKCMGWDAWHYWCNPSFRCQMCKESLETQFGSVTFFLQFYIWREMLLACLRYYCAHICGCHFFLDVKVVVHHMLFFTTRSTCIKYLPSGTHDINRIRTPNSRILTPESCCLAYLFITKMMVVFNLSLLQIYITLHIHNIYWGISHKLFLGPIVYLFS